MKILVFVKQVPDTDDVKLDERGNLKRDGVASMINPLDANAVEAAIQLKEKYGATVVAISMGPPQAEDVLKKALALGCDEAYLLSDRAFGGADTLATAYTLAKGAEKIGDYDLLLFGRHAVDGDTAQTGRRRLSISSGIYSIKCRVIKTDFTVLGPRASAVMFQFPSPITKTVSSLFSLISAESSFAQTRHASS